MTEAHRFGIVGGLGMLGAADLFFKLAQALPAVPGEGPAGVLFEQRPFREGLHPGAAAASQNGRKLYVFDLLRQFEARGVQAVLLPCFLSHTFLPELRDEVRVPIVDMLAALKAEVEQRYPAARRIGVLTSDHVRAQRLFERYFESPGWQLVYPDDGTQAEAVMAAVYGPEGLKAGTLHGRPVALLARACEALLAQGAQAIVPGFAEIPLVVEALRARGLPVIDSNRAYVRAALSHGPAEGPVGPVKVGVVGGVGPAATVDFLAKLVQHTPAARDQEHLKVVVEQNPQIPDRTAHLVRQGTDPTVALYATCKRLEAAGAAMIAIPCNTAHAFVDRLQPSLSIPIVDMLAATAEHLGARLPAGATVGLLATTGTVQSGLYAEALARVGLALRVPDAAHQAGVMAAIYGPAGVKAGHTTGACVQQLGAALAHLVAQGAQAVVLGCTELPLVLAARDDHPVGGTTVPVVDPTALLAQRCVLLALAKARSA